AVMAAACSGGSAPPAAGTAGQADGEVRAAYLDAWVVRDTALHQADLSVLSRRFADRDPSAVVGNLPAGTPSAYQIVSDSVAARVAANLDVAGDVGHDIRAVEVADDGQSAQVADVVTDRTYLVDRRTGVQQSSAQPAVSNQVWFLVKDGADWKVVYFAQEDATTTRPNG